MVLWGSCLFPFGLAVKICVNGRKPAYWYRHGRNDKIQRDAFVNASPWIHYFWYYHHIIVRLAMLSGAL